MWKKFFERLLSIRSVDGAAPRWNEVFDRARVVPQDNTIADADMLTLGHENAARDERVEPLLDGLTAVLDRQIGRLRAERGDEIVDPRREFAPRHLRPERRRDERRRQHLIK